MKCQLATDLSDLKRLSKCTLIESQETWILEPPSISTLKNWSKSDKKIYLQNGLVY